MHTHTRTHTRTPAHTQTHTFTTFSLRKVRSFCLSSHNTHTPKHTHTHTHTLPPSPIDIRSVLFCLSPDNTHTHIHTLPASLIDVHSVLFCLSPCNTHTHARTHSRKIRRLRTGDSQTRLGFANFSLRLIGSTSTHGHTQFCSVGLLVTRTRTRTTSCSNS